MRPNPTWVLLLTLAACNNPSPSVLDPNPQPNPTFQGEVTVQKVEWGQTVLKGDLRLVAGKPALLRVHLVGSRDGLPGELKAEAFRGSTKLGELSFTGPATLPTAAPAAGDLAQTYRATVPADWVAAGLEVRLAADPDNRIGEPDEAGNRRTLTPAVGAGSVLNLTLVPVLQPGQTASPTLPNPDILKDFFPLREVRTTTRAPFSFGSSVTSSSGAWSSLLSALRALRTQDGSANYYYGVVKVNYSSGIAGIGYVPGPASAGWDHANSAGRIMVHEVGHNLSLGHSPCGTSGDPAYPYAGASIGTWGYSVLNAATYDPARFKDVMSYCSPQWISDYTYAKLQTYLEGRTAASAQALSTTQEVLLVSGRVRGGRVELNPLQTVLARPSLPLAGAYTLRLDTPAGLVEVPFKTERVAAPHGPDQAPDEAWSEEHFAFSLPVPGGVRGLEVRREGRQLFQRTAESRVRGQSLSSVRVSEAGGKVRLEWHANTYPYASIAHLGTERTTLGLWLEGGTAELPTQGLPEGGKFEVALSDGVNSERLERSR